MNSIIVHQNKSGEVVTTTLAIATGTENDHASVIKLVRTYIDDLHEFGLVGFEIRAREPGQHGGGDTEYAVLNEQQATLILTYMRNTAIVRQFKKAMVREFWHMRQKQKSNVISLPDFTNPAAAARAWADEVEAKQVALAQLEEARPAVQFVDKYVDSTGLKTFREVCKILQANESRFREFLSDRKIMYRLNGTWAPYQCHIDAGRFLVKTGVSHHNNHAFTDVRFTPKGVNWVAGEWGKHQIQGEVA